MAADDSMRALIGRENELQVLSACCIKLRASSLLPWRHFLS
jgi:hypothetical protein